MAEREIADAKAAFGRLIHEIIKQQFVVDTPLPLMPPDPVALPPEPAPVPEVQVPVPPVSQAGVPKSIFSAGDWVFLKEGAGASALSKMRPYRIEEVKGPNPGRIYIRSEAHNTVHPFNPARFRRATDAEVEAGVQLNRPQVPVVVQGRPPIRAKVPFPEINAGDYVKSFGSSAVYRVDRLTNTHGAYGLVMELNVTKVGEKKGEPGDGRRFYLIEGKVLDNGEYSVKLATEAEVQVAQVKAVGAKRSAQAPSSWRDYVHQQRVPVRSEPFPELVQGLRVIIRGYSGLYTVDSVFTQGEVGSRTALVRLTYADLAQARNRSCSLVEEGHVGQYPLRVATAEEVTRFEKVRVARAARVEEVGPIPIFQVGDNVVYRPGKADSYLDSTSKFVVQSVNPDNGLLELVLRDDPVIRRSGVSPASVRHRDVQSWVVPPVSELLQEGVRHSRPMLVHPGEQGPRSVRDILGWRVMSDHAVWRDGDKLLEIPRYGYGLDRAHPIILPHEGTSIAGRVDEGSLTGQTYALFRPSEWCQMCESHVPIEEGDVIMSRFDADCREFPVVRGTHPYIGRRLGSIYPNHFTLWRRWDKFGSEGRSRVLSGNPHFGKPLPLP